MKKAGEIIKSARVDQKLSIQDVAKGTKISEEYIRAIEADNFENLPNGIYAQLYVKKYAEFLNLSSQKMSAIFRRDYQKEEDTARFSIQNFNFLSKWQGYILAGILITIFLGYLAYQYLNYVRPPQIKINEITLTSQGKLVSGKTHSQATLKIDDQLVNLDEEGKFTYTADRQDDQIEIVVQSPAGRIRQVIRQL